MCVELTHLSDLLSVKAEFDIVESFLRAQNPVLERKDGSKMMGRMSARGKNIYAENPQTSAQIEQWIDYRATRLEGLASDRDLHSTLQELNSFLIDRVFLIGGATLTLADLLIYFGLYNIMKDLTFYEKERFINLSRWFNNVQHQKCVGLKLGKVFFQRNLLYSAKGHS